MRIFKGNKEFWQTIQVAVGLDYVERIKTAIRTCDGNAGSADTIEEAKAIYAARPDYAEVEFEDAEANNILTLLQKDIKHAKAVQALAESALKAAIAQVNA